MKKFLAVLTCAFACAFALSSSAKAAPIWTMGYYGGYRYNALPYDKLSFGGLTHIAHAFVVPNTDGTLNDTTYTITSARSSGLIQAAHTNNVKVLISIGGANSGETFRGAISGINRDKFIDNLLTFAYLRGYDGIDIDMEPILTSDETSYKDFIDKLRTKINSNSVALSFPRLLLTCAVGWDRAKFFEPMKDKFDQINIMTYGMSNTWPGWETWHHAPLLHTGLKINDGPRDFPSAQKTVADWLAAGMTPSKLGIGAAFYGQAWRRATAPNQPITNVTVAQPLDYKNILSTYYTPARYRWDSLAGAAYVSVDEAGTDNDYFVTYEDTRALRDKVLWTRKQGLGGLIIWELASGYVPNSSLPISQQHPLLEAVRAARIETLP